MTSLMSLCGAASAATAGDKAWQRWAVARAGVPAFPPEGRAASLRFLVPGLLSGLETLGATRE